MSLIDTPGAYPGMGAEERGQAEAIAYNLEAMMGLNVPVVCVVIGEGGSGGALAIGIGNHVHMLEHAVYSVISPEAASAILYREQGRAQQAAEALKPTAQDLKTLGVVDDIIEEPRGGAHKDHVEMAQRLADKVTASLDELASLSGEGRWRSVWRAFDSWGAPPKRVAWSPSAVHSDVMSYRLYVLVTLLIACGQPDPLGEAADSGALAADAGRSELRDAQSLPDAQPLDAPGVVPDAAARDHLVRRRRCTRRRRAGCGRAGQRAAGGGSPRFGAGRRRAIRRRSARCGARRRTSLCLRRVSAALP